jgi:hypothetical protein
LSLNHPQLQAEGVPNWSTGSSTLIPVIPAKAGIQAVFDLELKLNLDAGVRRHDKLRLKARDFDDPERILNSIALDESTENALSREAAKKLRLT